MAFRTIEVQLRASTASFRADMGAAAQATREFATETGRAAATSNQALQNLGRTGVVVGGVVAAGVGLAVKASIDFESAFAGVRKTVVASEAEFGQLRSGIRDMAKELPTSANEIAGVAEAAGQLGIQTGNILGFTRTMVDLGETTNLQAGDAATALARLANITQMPQTEFDRLGSTVVALGNSLATTESEIVDMSLRLAGAGSQVGMTEAQILALSGALSSVGIEAEAGGSAISKVMIDIASQVETGGDKLETFATVAGMSATEFSRAYREDAASALLAFIEGLGAMEAQGGSTLGVLADLGIEEVRMRDALLRASGAGDLFRQSLEKGTEAWEDSTALAAEAEQRYQTTAAQLEIVRNNVTDLAISMGDRLLPAVQGVASSTTGLLEGFSALPGPLQTVVTGVIVGTGAVAGLGGSLLLLAPRIMKTKADLAELAITAPRAAAGLSTLGAAAGVATAAILPLTAAMVAWGNIKTRGKEIADEFEASLPDPETLDDRRDRLNLLIDEYNRLQDVARSGGGIGKALREIGQITNPLDPNTISEAEAATHLLADAINAEQAELVKLEPALTAAMEATGLTEAEVMRLADSLGVDLTAAGFDGTVAIGQVINEAKRIGEAVPEAERLTMSLEDQEAAAEELLERLTELGDSYGEFTDALTAWNDVLDRAESDAQDRAQERADAENEAIDERIEGVRRSADETATALQREADDHIRSAELTGQAAEDVRRAAQDKADAVREGADDEAAALGDSKVAWEDYVEEVKVSTADLIAEWEAQIEAQQEWKTNLTEIVGRGRQDVAEILADMGPEGAQLAAQFADMTSEEFDRAADLFVQAMTDGGHEAGQALEDELEIATRIARSGSRDTARSIAEELGVLPATVASIAGGMGIELGKALSDMVVGTEEYVGRIQYIYENAGVVGIGGNAKVNRWGGVYAAGGTVAFATGGITPAHIAFGTRYKWAEPATAGETFVPHPAARLRAALIEETSA